MSWGQWWPRHGADRDEDRSFARYIGTVANSCPDDCGLGSNKTFRPSIKCVANYCELSEKEP